MNHVPIILPDLGGPHCRLSLWLVRSGETIREGDRVVEIAFPGAIVDLPAPADGILRERLAQNGDPLQNGQILGTIEPLDH